VQLVIISLAALLASAACGQYEEVRENLKFAFPEYTKCDVTQVFDDTTFYCQLSDRQMEKVRLTGIEIPDSIENEAAGFTESHLRRGMPVKLEFDRETRDKFGLILAYAYLPGDKMLNALLIQEGYAKVDTNAPNLKFKDLFLKLETEARTQGKGLWEKE
jgi:micrococcal nuclease